MNSIPSISSSCNVPNFEKPKSQNFKGAKIQRLLTDEIMFDSEFDLTPLTSALPKPEMISDAVSAEEWDFDQIITQIDAENNSRKIEKSRKDENEGLKK